MIFDLFSKRNKPNIYEIYTFDELPEKFRIQVLHIWRSALGDISKYNNDITRVVFKQIKNIMCKEHGLLELYDDGRDLPAYDQCINFLLKEEDVLKVLDLIELSLRFTEVLREDTASYRLEEAGITQEPSEVVKDINYRFKENGIGYEYHNSRILRKDSEIIYQEATKPAITLLNEANFKGAEDEFINAHSLYKEGKNKEAISEALKSFESTMKTICHRNNWQVEGKGTAVPLINTIFKNNLVPSHFQTQINSLKTTLEGLATVRNKHSGHGQGENSISVPDYLASYALNLCATNIVFLINAYKEKEWFLRISSLS